MSEIQKFKLMILVQDFGKRKRIYWSRSKILFCISTSLSGLLFLLFWEIDFTCGAKDRPDAEVVWKNMKQSVLSSFNFIQIFHIFCMMVGDFLHACFSLHITFSYEPHREKTGFLHMRKQRRRSASR